PVVLSKSAAAPTAVLESALLRASAPPPTPVLKLPVESKKSERQPSAVFPAPVVRRLSASHPSTVVKLGKHPSGAGLTARAPGKSAKQAISSRMAINIFLRFFIFFNFLFVVNSFKVCSQSLWPPAYSFRVGCSLYGFARSALSTGLCASLFVAVAAWPLPASSEL